MRMKRWKKSDNHDFIFSYATVKEKTPVSASAPLKHGQQKLPNSNSTCKYVQVEKE